MCFAVEEIVRRFDTFNFYETCDWYTFPTKIQRILPFVISKTQTSVGFAAYGNIACNRETCKLVNTIRVNFMNHSCSSFVVVFKYFFRLSKEDGLFLCYFTNLSSRN